MGPQWSRPEPNAPRRGLALASLAAADPGTSAYAYALLDLGRSLRLAGHPRAGLSRPQTP